MDKFKVIIVEDDKLELKGTQQILQTEVPEAEVIGTASGESDFWRLMREGQPDLVLLDHTIPLCSARSRSPALPL